MIDRRSFIRASAIVSGAVLAGVTPVLAADAEIEITPREDGPEINAHLYGQFIEHLGGVIYDGIWVGKDSKIPNVGGIRKQFIDDMVNKWHVMPPGVSDANATTTAFFQGRTAMMILSTGSLSFVRDNMKTPYKVAFLPHRLMNAAPIGGGSLLIPRGNSPERQAAAWTLINWLVSPEIAGQWSRFTGYFAPRIAAEK